MLRHKQTDYPVPSLPFNLMVLFASLLIGCSESIPQIQLDRISPEAITEGQAVQLTIYGKNFQSRVARDLNSTKEFSQYNDFKVWLLDANEPESPKRPCGDVQRKSVTELTALPPLKLPVGTYTVIVESPFDDNERLEDAFKVVTASDNSETDLKSTNTGQETESDTESATGVNSATDSSTPIQTDSISNTDASDTVFVNDIATEHPTELTSDSTVETQTPQVTDSTLPTETSDQATDTQEHRNADTATDSETYLEEATDSISTASEIVNTETTTDSQLPDGGEDTRFSETESDTDTVVGTDIDIESDTTQETEPNTAIPTDTARSTDTLMASDTTASTDTAVPTDTTFSTDTHIQEPGECSDQYLNALGCTGFEVGLTYEAWFNYGDLVINDSNPQSGNQSLQANVYQGGGTANIDIPFEPVTSGPIYFRAYFYIPSGMLNDQIKVLGFRGPFSEVTQEHVHIVDILLLSNNRIAAYDHASQEISISNANAFQQEEWFCLHGVMEVSDNMGAVKLAVNDDESLAPVEEIDTLPEGGVTAMDIGISWMADGQFSAELYLDDVVVDTNEVECQSLN